MTLWSLVWLHGVFLIAVLKSNVREEDFTLLHSSQRYIPCWPEGLMAGARSGECQFIPKQEPEREQEVRVGYKTSRGVLMTHFLQQADSIPKVPQHSLPLLPAEEGMFT